MSGSQQGRVIVVTGASSGVGAHLARALAADGARVALLARRAAALEGEVSAIAGAGGEAMAVACDVTDEAAVVAAFDAVEARFGLADGVIVNAGMNHAGPAVALDGDGFDAILSVNLRGAFLTAREGGRRMIEAARSGSAQQPRRILFVASVLGLRPAVGTVAYSASKAGMVMLARGLAKEWARHGINVNALCPGYMPTDIVGNWFETEAGRDQIAGWPRRRLMPVAALEGAVRYLLSPAADCTTGAVLTVDDGQTL